MQLRNLLLRQRRDGASRRSARLDGTRRPDRSARFCGAARPHGSYGCNGRYGSRGPAGAYRSYRTDGGNGCYGSLGSYGRYGNKRDRSHGSDGHYRPYRSHGRNRAGYIRETKTAIRKSKKSSRTRNSAAFLHTVWFLCHSATPPHLSCRCKSIFYLKIVKIQFEFILCRKAGISQIAAFAFPFFQPAIVKQFQFFVNDKRHDIILQTLFEK